MTPSGSAFVFTDEKPSWVHVDLEKIIHICCTPNIDHRKRYTFDNTDINVIVYIMR